MNSKILPELRALAVPVGELVPDAANARVHDVRNLEAIKDSLRRFGQRAPIVVQREGMIVRAGNGRLAAAKALGWGEIAAVVVDVSAQRRQDATGKAATLPTGETFDEVRGKRLR